MDELRCRTGWFLSGKTDGAPCNYTKGSLFHVDAQRTASAASDLNISAHSISELFVRSVHNTSNPTANCVCYICYTKLNGLSVVMRLIKCNVAIS